MVWDYSGWGKRKKITIDGIGDSAPTNYQFKLTTIIFDSDMKTDFSDLRFGDGSGGLLSFWIENKVDSTSAEVWVKIPTISNTVTTPIYMYYGNLSASNESNGENTFFFFDDFEGSSINLSKWNQAAVDGTTTVSNSILTLTSSGGSNRWGAKVQIDSTVYISESRVKFTESYQTSWGIDDRSIDGITTGAYQDSVWIWYNASKQYFTVSGGSSGGISRTNDLSTYHILGVVTTSTPNAKFYVDYVLDGTVTLNIPTDNLGFWFVSRSVPSIIDIDWARYRLFITSEPTQSIGSEENEPTDNGIFFGNNF